MSSTFAVQASSSEFNTSRSQSEAGETQPGRTQLATGHTSRDNVCFQSGLPTPPVTKDMTGISVTNGQGNHPMDYQHLNGYRRGGGTTDHTGPKHHHSTSDSYADSRQGKELKYNGQFYYPTNPSKANQIATYLQIPESVNKSKGSLAEFAAEITCLFWFENASTLEYAENLALDAISDRGLDPDATPAIGFRKWVTTILSTTQVGRNVILLALMFIYRLKKFNPSVSGKRGSEFRLLTIALMLGNKFLDDNTYTNKTWAEVSGISVNEIHIMEVEFLSNMRYELYASESQWMEWKSKLGRFGSFYDKASRFVPSDDTKVKLPTTPVSSTMSNKIPSPPSGSYSNTNSYSGLPNPMTTLPHLPQSPVRHLGPLNYPYERKRSLDSSADLPPAKRLHYPTAVSAHPSPSTMTPNSIFTPDSMASVSFMSNSSDHFNGPRIQQLPIPRISPPIAGPGMQLAPLTLPANRSMSTVYPVTSLPYSQAANPMSTIPHNLTQIYPLQGVGDGSRAPSHNGSANTSPIDLYGTATPTRPGLSPSYFLTNRSSPYRPVRNVNTLLFPPPSAAMQNPVRNIGYDQIHYQPLSKSSTERHSGPVPFLQPDAWQSHVLTPLSQQYRPY